MYSYSALAGISGGLMIFGLLLLFIFGQVTVRRLRKKAETRDHLGLAFINGDDIYNVAAVLSYPNFFKNG